MARVFVSGGSGFIGTNLIESLLRDGWEVLNYDMFPPRNAEHCRVFHRGDVRDGQALTGAVRQFRPELVVHLAARTDLEGASLGDYDTNIIGVRNMIDAIRSAGASSRVLFASSRYVHKTEVFPHEDDDYSPFTLYGQSKVETERIVRSSRLEIPWLLFRPTSVWGPWFRIPYRMFFDTVRRGLYVHPKGLRICKSYGFVGNIVHQIRQLMAVDAREIDKKTLYVSDDRNMDILEFAQAIQAAFGAPPVRQVPMAVLQGLAHAGDLLKRFGVPNPPLTSFRLGNLLTPMEYDMSKTCKVAGPSPYTLEEGVRITVDWIRQHE